MKLLDLFEYSSANPFVGIVSNIDLRIREVETAVHASSHSLVFISSLKNQLNTLLKFLDSSVHWNIPEIKLRSDLRTALPKIKSHVKDAINALTSDSMKDAKDSLFAARNIAIKYSHLKFGGIE